MEGMTQAEFEREIVLRLIIEHIRGMAGQLSTVEEQFKNPQGLLQEWKRLARLAASVAYGSDAKVNPYG